MVSSRDEHGKQNIPIGSYPEGLAVQPQSSLGVQSTSSAQINTISCDKERYQLLEEILSKDNLKAALKKVEENRGAAGSDGMKVEGLREYLKQEWAHIRQALSDGTYKPSPVLRVVIPKADGGKRPLGIPTALDRMIAQAIAQVLSPIFEASFSEHSHGFRPNRSAHDAVLHAKRHIEEGYSWVVDIDIKSFFDRVNHDILMSRVARKIKDKRVLRLIRRYLSSGIMANGVVMTAQEGTPQGSPLSPLLANIMLDDLDKELERRGHRFERYADDCNIYVRSERSGRRVYASIKAFLEEKLKLKVNEDKSAVDRPQRRKFLGFSFYTAKGKVGIRLAPSVIKRQKGKIKEMTRRNQGISIDKVIKSINRQMIGFINYFAIADMKEFLSKLDGWIRRKLRVILWKSWKKQRTRFKKLRGLGLPLEQTKMIVSSRKSYWRISNTPQLNKAMGVAFFNDLGLINLVDRYISVSLSRSTAVYRTVRTVV